MPTIHKLSNGLVVIVEEIPHVASAAYELLIPGGVVTDPDGLEGSSLILSEITSRGAGDLNSRQLSEAFDLLGVAHGEAASLDSFVYRGSLLASKLEQSLELLSMMVQKPAFPIEEIDNVRSLFLQDLAALADNPMRRVVVELGSGYYPFPWGRPSHGTEEGLKATNLEILRSAHQQKFKPNGAVLSIAGNVCSAKLLNTLERLFKDWKGDSVQLPAVPEMPRHQNLHTNFDSAQVQIALCYPSAKFGDKHYYDAKVATSVLSGGMFGRLFVEIREKKGLCYSVRARHAGGKHFGTILAYAGTTPERAHETFELLVREMRSLRTTVSDAELQRSKVDLKSGKIIGEESTGAQASSNASDWWLGGEVRPLAEILDGISSVTSSSIDQYLDAFPMRSFASLTLGPKEIAVPQ